MDRITQEIANNQVASIKWHELKLKSMSVAIANLQEDQYQVNGKLLYKDSNGDWIAAEELTTNESKAFREHLQSINNMGR